MKKTKKNTIKKVDPPAWWAPRDFVNDPIQWGKDK